MSPKTPMNEKFATKVAGYLEAKEGCQVINFEYTLAGTKTTIKDAFGFVYELNVKTIGRNQTEIGDMERYNGGKK